MPDELIPLALSEKAVPKTSDPVAAEDVVLAELIALYIELVVVSLDASSANFSVSLGSIFNRALNAVLLDVILLICMLIFSCL